MKEDLQEKEGMHRDREGSSTILHRDQEVSPTGARLHAGFRFLHDVAGGDCDAYLGSGDEFCKRVLA